MSVLESQEEILSDIIVFDKNNAYENYILVFELVPEKLKDYELLKLSSTENLSLSIYSFADFEIVEIPFKKIDYNISRTVHFQGCNLKTMNSDALATIFPLFKMTCNYFGYYEIRVEGLNQYYYGIYIYKAKGYRNSILCKYYHKSSPEKNKEVASLNFKLDMGTYVV